MSLMYTGLHFLEKSIGIFVKLGEIRVLEGDKGERGKEGKKESNRK